MAKKLEIEKKYLLKRLPELKWDKILHIFQYYLPDGSRIRETRDATPSKGHFKGQTIPFPFGVNPKFERTIKKKLKAGVYEEDERKISRKEFEESKKTALSFITKVRYVHKVDKNLKWEVDVYQNVNMVTAEIELPRENFRFQLPPAICKELVMDVTKFRQMTNKSMAVYINQK